MTYHSVFSHFIVELCPNLLYYDNYTVTLIIYEIQQTVHYCGGWCYCWYTVSWQERPWNEILMVEVDGEVGVMLQSRGYWSNLSPLTLATILSQITDVRRLATGFIETDYLRTSVSNKSKIADLILIERRMTSSNSRGLGGKFAAVLPLFLIAVNLQSSHCTKTEEMPEHERVDLWTKSEWKNRLYTGRCLRYNSSKYCSVFLSMDCLNPRIYSIFQNIASLQPMMCSVILWWHKSLLRTLFTSYSLLELEWSNTTLLEYHCRTLHLFFTVVANECLIVSLFAC